MTRADLGKDPSQVSACSIGSPPGYDRTNTVLSIGNAPLWRVATTRAVAPQAGGAHPRRRRRHGHLERRLASSGATVVAADFSPGMIEGGRRRQAGIPNLVFVEADATKLPFGDDEFDAVTISFGLRNVNEPKKALAELLPRHQARRPPRDLRVLAPAVVALHTGRLPLLQRLVMPPSSQDSSSSNADAYDYLNESIRDWPDQRDPRRLDPRGGLDGRRVPQPHDRHRRAAPRAQAGA